MMREVLEPAMQEVESLRYRAAEGEDLSHNPLARGAIGAGEPESFIVKGPPDPGRNRDKTYYYRRRRTDRIGAFAKGQNPTVEAQVAALEETLAEGAYDE